MVVDLARARGALDRLSAVLREAPADVRDRTAAYLAGDLPGFTPEDLTMPDDTRTTPDQPVRIPLDLLDLADTLVEPLRGAPALRAYGRSSRATVIRLALARGLAALREDLRAAGQVVPDAPASGRVARD